MTNSEPNQKVCQAVERVRAQVVEAALADQYRNPFWDERYPEYGRDHSRKDNHYHLDFLLTTLRLDLPSTFFDYCAWLRPLLVMRGMCTRHLQQNLESLFGHLHAALPEYWPALGPCFEAAQAAMQYHNPACQALAACEQQVARAAAERMWQSSPAWEQKYGPAARLRFDEDNLFHLSYLKDAVELNNGALFGKYRAWLSGFLARRGIAAGSTYAALTGLGEELGRALPPEQAAPFLALLQEHLQP